MAQMTDATTIQQEVTSLVRAWQEAFDRGDTAGVAEFYTEEAVSRLSSGRILRGRDAIHDWIRESLDDGVKFRFSVVESELLESGREAFSWVGWTALTEAGEVGEGELFLLHKLVDGEWKVHRTFSASPPESGA